MFPASCAWTLCCSHEYYSSKNSRVCKSIELTSLKNCDVYRCVLYEKLSEKDKKSGKQALQKWSRNRKTLKMITVKWWLTEISQVKIDQSQSAETLKSNTGVVSFCRIGIQNAMLYTQKYTPLHCFFINFACWDLFTYQSI